MLSAGRPLRILAGEAQIHCAINYQPETMMRVLFWSGAFWPQIGGVEVLAAKFLPALRERGYEYVVVAPKAFADLPDESRFKGIPVYRFPFQNNQTNGNLDHFITIRQKIAVLKRSFAPDLVHINAVGVNNFFHLSTANAHRAPVLITLHGKWTRESEAIVGQTLRDADWVVGCSAAIVEEGRKLAHQIARRSSIIYNGVGPSLLSPTSLPFGAPRLLCLGRLSPEKGFDLVLEALAAILKRFPHLCLILAGNGPSRSELEQQAARAGISHAVQFTGWIAPDAVPALINDATLVVMPSRQDSLPLVALEAAQLARPVVATRVGGLPEVVVHHETGLLVDKEDSAGLAQAISFLIDNPDAAVRMGQAARKRVETVFSWNKHVDAYDALYRRLIEGNDATCPV
jgi:glycosyltransferase involved in cell wall biosynthesis